MRHSFRGQYMQDRYGYEVTSSSARAVEHLDEALRLSTSLRLGAVDAYKDCLAEDSDLALAHAGLAFLLSAGGQTVRAGESLTTARRLGVTTTRREQQHIEVVGAFVAGDLERTLELGREHLSEFPRDIRMIGVTIFSLNFGGRPDRKRAALQLMRSLRPALEGEGYWESALGFLCTENDLWVEGRRHAEIGFAADPGSFHGAHVVTHVHHEAGDTTSGLGFLGPWLDTADGATPYSGHLTWHLALFELARGETERAIAIFDRSLRPAVYPGIPRASLTDASSFLWRLNLYGVPLPEGAAAEVRELASEHFTESSTSFIDAHVALALGSCGDVEAVDRWASMLRSHLADGKVAAGEVLPIIAEAVADFARGQFDACADLLDSRTEEFVRLGGSRAQFEVFADTLIGACLRSGRNERARQLLDERLKRRPSRADERLLAAAMG